jgi:hypothetical protein
MEKWNSHSKEFSGQGNIDMHSKAAKVLSWRRYGLYPPVLNVGVFDFCSQKVRPESDVSGFSEGSGGWCLAGDCRPITNDF